MVDNRLLQELLEQEQENNLFLEKQMEATQRKIKDANLVILLSAIATIIFMVGIYVLYKIYDLPSVTLIAEDCLIGLLGVLVFIYYVLNKPEKNK